MKLMTCWISKLKNLPESGRILETHFTWIFALVFFSWVNILQETPKIFLILVSIVIKNENTLNIFNSVDYYSFIIKFTKGL
jgi:hypothetical protein